MLARLDLKATMPKQAKKSRSATVSGSTSGSGSTRDSNPASAIHFVIAGQLQTSAVSRGASPLSDAEAPSHRAWPGQLKSSVRLSARRGAASAGSTAGQTVRVSAVPGEDVVLLHIAGGPALLLHPETARDLMRGQGTQTRGSDTQTAADSSDVPVPSQLRWRGLEQAAPTRSGGFLGDVLLSAFEVLTGFAKDNASKFVASQVVQKMDGQVDAGVYALQPETLLALKGSGFKLAQVPSPAQPASEPLLVLVHGTFVDTFSTFGKLWALHPQSVSALFAHYGGRVYALDHPTLGASPLANALTLVQALPAGARLHLVTHSRGGLVAEALARVAGLPAGQVTAQDLALFPGAEYAVQRQELLDLATAVHSKGIKVERVVRVACPARGTLLASTRLDAYISVLKWSLELAGLVVLPGLVDFLAEVARRRANPLELPGMAAMMPDSPLVNWLNAAEEAVPGDLRVVAGDLQGDSVGSWLKTLLADAYYWTDNDIVVQTRSMYGGAPRAGGASFLLDQGGKVTHFNYFSNERTVQAVVGALTQAQPAGFKTIGPLSWAGQDSGGQRGGAEAPNALARASKPAVFVLPGILGSHLKAGDKRIWLSLRLIGGLGKLKYQADGADAVLSDGPIGLIYDDLIDHLAASHDVIPFGFDWRRPIEEEAQRLADAIDLALDARNASGQPVRLLAHSMGGVLARTVQLERPKTWARLMQREGARFLMLGTPNGGSWAPMQVLSGDDTFGNALAAFGSPLRDRQARQMMAEMPGFIQLQAALLDPARGLDQAATWARLAADDLKRVQDNNWWHRAAGESQDAAYEWGLPPQAVLDQACQLRVRLDAQLSSDLKAFSEKTLLVVGHAKFTPDGYEWGADGFAYLDATDGGDGRVPLASALLPGVNTWKLDCEHGSLPDNKSAFSAFDELLVKGDTSLLDRWVQPALARGAGATSVAAFAHVRSRPSRARPSAVPADSERSVFASGRGWAVEAPDGKAGAALQVSVINGNLSFVRHSLMVGHSRALSLTGTEGVLNKLIGGAMKASLDAGLYPDAPGSQQIFINTRYDPDNPWRTPQPAMAVVVGLGEEGQLTEQSLARTVRQGVIAWAQRVSENAAVGTGGSGGLGAAPAELSLAATLMGSGGVGMNCSNAARAIAIGVRDANERMADSGWPLISHLWLVELYLERASDAWHGLQVLAASAPGRFEVSPTIASGVGPLRRQIDSGYRGADYDFIRATSPSEGTISFALDTKRARTEISAQSTQGRLLRELVARASTASSQDPRLGHTLFQLLVPPEVEPFLAGTSRMLLELDDATAAIPWELLDTRGEDQARNDDRPWAIRTQLLRKLRQDTYRQQVQDANPDDAVLVIGEPLVDVKRYAALPGARSEALAVVAALGAAGALGAQRVTALISSVAANPNDATSVINALFERRYRIVHIAGHGEPVQRSKATASQPGKLLSKGGVVLSDGTFLGSDEIKSMRTVPELVFVNCCHLAARDANQALNNPAGSGPRAFNRAEFAWGVADSLIEIGVRCVIAAGWAVDDGPAAVFATTFYREILNRKPFISAVAAAREAAWLEDKNSNTWAAYQAYGDPNWTYRRNAGDEAAAPLPPREQFDGIASPLALTLALEEVAVQSKWMRADSAAQLEKVRHLEARFAPLWASMGAVAEAFGVAYAEAGDADQAIHWYQRALQAEDASASIKTHEQLGNQQARRGWARAAGVAKGSKTEAAMLARARTEITQALQGLSGLAQMQPTLERLCLCGSASKRLAMLERRAGNSAAELVALQQAEKAYAGAAALQQQSTGAAHSAFYPQSNRLALALVLQMVQTPTASPFGATTLAQHAPAIQAIRQSLQAQTAHSPDFWSYAGLIEIDVYEALAAGRLAGPMGSVLDRFIQLHGRVAAHSLWGSVADQAHWLLTPYIAYASTASTASEKSATQSLLKLLSGFTD